MTVKIEMLEDHNHGVAGMLKAGETYDVDESVAAQIKRDFPHKVKGVKVNKTTRSPKDKQIGTSPKRKGKTMSSKSSKWGGKG